MSTIKNILVGLDLSDFDRNIIAYTKFFHSIIKSESIDFVYVKKKQNSEQEELDSSSVVSKTDDNSLVQEMISKTYGNYVPDVEINYHIHKGSPYKDLLKHTEFDKSQLLVVGKKNESLKAEKQLSRNLSSNILFVPKAPKLNIKRILVPFDFSKDSENSLQMAIEIAKPINAEIFCQYVYEVPEDYDKAGKTYEEFLENLKNSFQKKFSSLYDKISFDGVKVIPGIISFFDYRKVSHIIKEKSNEKSIDLIVIGPKGRTKIASVLLDSVAEELVCSTLKCPILLCKEDPKSKMDFWDRIDHMNSGLIL